MARLRGGHWRRSAAFLAIWGLLCQAVLTAAAIPVAFAATNPAALPAGYTSLVICTGSGMKRITLDAEGNRVEEQDSNNMSVQCTACHVTGGSVLAATPISTLATLEYVLVPMAPSAGRTCFDEHQNLCPDSRAPPSRTLKNIQSFACSDAPARPARWPISIIFGV